MKKAKTAKLKLNDTQVQFMVDEFLKRIKKLENRWRRAKKLLRDIGGPGECKCEWQVHANRYLHPYGEEACPACKAFGFLENLNYYERGHPRKKKNA